MILKEFLLDLKQQGITLWREGDRLRCRAPEGVLTAALVAQLQEHKPDILALLTQVQPTTQLPPLVPVPRDEPLSLSFGQTRMWFLSQLEERVHAYHDSLAIEVTGALDRTALQQSWQALVARHEILRTRYRSEDGYVYQEVLSPGTDALMFESLPAVPERNSAAWLAARVAQPFALHDEPPCRLHLLQVAADQHLLLFVIHHIAVDGWSWGVLWHEWRQLYTAAVQGQKAALAPLPIQYADYAAWQRGWLRGATLERELTFWRQQLAGAPDLLDLPLDYPRPAVQRYQGASLTFTIDPPLLAKLQQLCIRQDATLFMALLAAFNVLLYRYSRQADIVVGTPIANRLDRETEGLIGMFVNTLALRTQLADNLSFLDLLAQISENTQAAYQHQGLPFEALVEALQPERRLSHTPLFQVMFILQNNPPTELALPNLTVRHLVPPTATTKFDLTLSIMAHEEGLLAWWEYNTDLFAPATIARLAGHYQSLLTGIMANPDQPICDLPLLTPAERAQLLVTWNATSADYPQTVCLHELFEAQVVRTPAAPAVLMATESAGAAGPALTYRELNARANQLAHHLRGLGVGPEVLVGICVERSLEMVVGLLGILKAGGAYVPLDPTYPPDRLAFMLADSAAPVLLTQAHLQAKLPATTATVVCLDTAWPTIAQHATTNPAVAVQPDNLAYVIYTSGSTGQPKGAMNEHRGVVNRLLWMQDAYGLTAVDRVLQKTPFSFDVSVWEFFWPLLTGAQLVVAKPEGHKDPDYLAALIQAAEITTVHFVPSMLSAFLEAAAVRACHSLRRVICSGEALPYALQQRFFAKLSSELHNLYGPTEAAVDVSYWACQAASPLGIVPIGRPVANTQLYVLDAQLAPVPIGVAGELHIGGVQVGRGYLQRPALTAEKFIANPFGAGRLYKTGDLARWLPNGNIEYLGRLDYQVKIRGFRIELGEIETVLTQHPAVQQAVVVARTERDETRLVAYVVLEHNEDTLPAAALDPAVLRTYLAHKLPDYMVPRLFVLLDALPLSPNGKLDRKALPAPVSTGLITPHFTPPQTPMEAQLAAIWQEVLGVAQVGRHDNFFEIGGHSLLATQVIARLRKTLGLELRIRTLFEAPVLALLSQQLELLQRAANPAPPPTTAGEDDTWEEEKW